MNLDLIFSLTINLCNRQKVRSLQKECELDLEGLTSILIYKHGGYLLFSPVTLSEVSWGNT